MELELELELELEKSESNWGLPLPQRIAPIIFSKVPISNLPAFRLVSKSWNRLVVHYAPTSTPKAVLFSTNVYNPGFGARFLHPKIHCFDIDTLSLVASCAIIGPLTEFISIYSCCNGLLFLENGGIEIGCDSEGIFNPMTHEFFPTPMHDEFFCDGFFHGFGFTPNTKQYKLFRVLHSGCDMRVLRFGRNHNQWIRLTLPSPITLRSHGCYMDGVIYWIGGKERNEYLIYALDVETEVLELIFVRNVVDDLRTAFLQPLDGTIFAIFMTKSSQVQVWKMQDKRTWITDFIVHGDLKSFELIEVTDDGKIFFVVDKDLFWLNKCEERIEAKNKMKTLIPCDRRFNHLCGSPIQSLHFGSLSDILAGGNA